MSRIMRASAMFVVVLLFGCGATFEEMRHGPIAGDRLGAPADERILIPPHDDRAVLTVSQEAFLAFMASTLPRIRATEEEVRALMLENWQSVLPRPQRSFHLVQVSTETDPMVDGYLAWCTSRRLAHDCSGALRGQPYLDAQGRYRIAFDIALGAEWAGFVNELQGFVDPTHVKVMLLGAMVLYMATLAIPELVTKFVAAAITVVLTAYLGAQTVWELVFGWIEMVRAADRATTFAELYAAGERYGQRVGAQFTRVLVMVVTAAIAEGGLVARVLKLPNAPLASRAIGADTGGRLSLGGMKQVRGVSVAAGGVTVVVAPGAEASQAVGAAMAARRAGSTGAQPKEDCDEKPEKHHIATIENSKATVRGGPWTPRFDNLFRQAGMTLNDAANLVTVKGHRGPHPEEYHRLVYKRLFDALATCQTTQACRTLLTGELRNLADEIVTPGNRLNELVTRGCAK